MGSCFQLSSFLLSEKNNLVPRAFPFKIGRGISQFQREKALGTRLEKTAHLSPSSETRQKPVRKHGAQDPGGEKHAYFLSPGSRAAFFLVGFFCVSLDGLENLNTRFLGGDNVKTSSPWSRKQWTKIKSCVDQGIV